MPSESIYELFKGEPFDVVSGGRDVVEYEPLKESEERAIERCVMCTYRVMRKVSSSIAEEFLAHMSVFKKFGMIVKRAFGVSKPITFPAQAGTIGVSPIIPQAVKYATTGEGSYTGYVDNTWNIDLTANTPAYILGSATNYYRASPTSEQHVLLVIMQDGIIEIGTTPKLKQLRYESEQQTKWSPWAVHPLVELPIDSDRTIYQYNTIGVIPVYHDLGVKLVAMPYASGTATIPLLGVFFYEFNFWSTLKTI
ncbi:MAG: hypothetical protein QW328_08990 [Nitrososphaerota archaeon]